MKKQVWYDTGFDLSWMSAMNWPRKGLGCHYRKSWPKEKIPYLFEI